MSSYAQVRAMFPTTYDETPYAWIITKDLLWEDDEYCTHSRIITVNGPDRSRCADCFGMSEVGVRGPFQATSVQFAIANACGARFRILDDDGIPYYEGYCWTSDGNLDFGPLDDFGTPNAGATELQYMNDETGEWETL